MKLFRVNALIERDMRKFFRSPALMMASMVFPLVQLIVLGYAFGGKIKGAVVAVVDQDQTVQSRRLREMMNGISAGPQTFRTVEYKSLPQAINDLRSGFVAAVIDIPYDFTQRYYQRNRPRISFTEDNTDQFVSSSLLERVQQMVNELNTPDVEPRLASQVDLNVVEMYPYIEYIKYLLAGSIAMSIFIVAMIGGGITFIDDKARGLHEGYLVTPIQKTELVMGLIGAGALKGIDGGIHSHDHRRADCGDSAALGSGSAVLPRDCGACSFGRDDQLHVSRDGARGRSACAARDFWRAEYAAVFPFGRGVSGRGVSGLAEMDFVRGSVHIHGARAAKSHDQEHRLRRNLQGRLNFVHLFCHHDWREHRAVQAAIII